jgi:uncharacterized protein (TIGR00297 family)
MASANILHLVFVPDRSRNLHSLRNSIPAFIVTNVAYLVQLGDLTSFRDRWAIGGLLTLLFSGFARWVHGVTTAGALVGAVVCFVLYLGGGPGAFAALITVFALAWITTRLGYSRKQKLGVAERREGRSASQVLANLGVATICAAIFIFIFGQGKIILLAMSAALSEAAADTVSSEIGQAVGETPRLITNWKSVPAGTNGAVSLMGTFAGIAAAGIVSVVCLLGGLLPQRWLAVSIGAAILGMVVDSFLGACLERRNLLNNDSVNFLGTLAAAVGSSLFARVWLA